MADKKAKITYKLEDPFPYAFEGDMREAEFIELSAPTSKNRDECAAMKESFFVALPEPSPEMIAAAAANDKNSSDSEMTGEEILAMLSMSPDVELAEVLRLGTRLLIKGKKAKVDGEELLTNTLLELMSYDDLEAMIGEYLVGFILRSALGKRKTN